MILRPGLECIGRLVTKNPPLPIGQVPPNIGTADLFIPDDDDGESKLCIMEGRSIPKTISKRVIDDHYIADAFVIVVRRLGLRGDVRRDPQIPEEREASECSYIILWSLENPEDQLEGSFARLSVLDIAHASEKDIWLTERPGSTSLYYPII